MASAAGYGPAAGLFTGTTSVPAAYAGAFLWGVAGTTFGAVALTALQQVAPVHAHGRVMGINATVQSGVAAAAGLAGLGAATSRTRRAAGRVTG